MLLRKLGEASGKGSRRFLLPDSGEEVRSCSLSVVGEGVGLR